MNVEIEAIGILIRSFVKISTDLYLFRKYIMWIVHNGLKLD